MTSGAFVPVSSDFCTSEYPSLDYLCEVYDWNLLGAAIVLVTEIDFQVMAGNDLVPNSLINNDDPLSDWSGFTRLADGFTVRLSPTLGNDESPFLCQQDVVESELALIIVPSACFEVFILPIGQEVGPFSVSLRRFVYVTGGETVEVNNVPEPFAALLLALGTAFAARRLRRR